MVVVVIYVDLTKAFDRVRHYALLLKYLQLDPPDYIHDWFMDYIKGWGHSLRAADASSLIASIDTYVVQCFGLGPPSYAAEASDRHPRHC